MKYRSDIDGLRAISVISVILFHLGFTLFSGGYVGVDIFFVISGYLISSLVYDEIRSGKFTYIGFYKRRIARLMPALLITLLIVFIFGFIFYDNKAYDNLGKEVFFSVIGAANILFAQGVDYFAQEETVRPLIHLWSLGVEEQFYLVWPTILVVLLFMKLRNVFIATSLIFAFLFLISILKSNSEPMIAYFHPQYRAFELILGALAALYSKSDYFLNIRFSHVQREIITTVSVLLMILPIFLLDKTSIFPGFNALYPSLGAALFISFSQNSIASKILSSPFLVFIGLISYPLYLYHQPIISYISFFKITDDKYIELFLTLLISIPLAWVTYKYIEQPIRKAAHKTHNSSKPYILLIAGLAILALSGLYVAKHDGLIIRFKYLNPFSYEVSQKSATSFHANFEKGYDISKKDHKKILFVGDSVLQQYAYPIMKALDLNKSDIDSVTFGGCNLLKNIDFKEKFTGVSCNGLREKLYEIDKHYDYIIISQQWDIYSDQIENFPITKKDSIEKWDPFIKATLEHFLKMSDHIILLGEHISVKGTDKLKPTIFLTKEKYNQNLNNLEIVNADLMESERKYFDKFKSDKVTILHPIDIWSDDKEIRYKDENWSYFSDHMHASNASNKYLIEQFKKLLY